MRKLFFAAAALLLGLTSCTKEEALDPSPAPSGQTKVSLTLTGSTNSAEYGKTRAAGVDGTVTGKLAASAEEKNVTSLLAVAFHKHGLDAGKIYKVFEVKDIETPNPWFDMTSEGTYNVWFVANADPTLTAAITNLTQNTENTETQLKELVGSQVPDAANAFLMVSTDKKSITTNNGMTTPVSVLMRRASVRYDIINRINGVTVTKIEFKNYAADTHIGTPNSQATGTTFTPSKIYGGDGTVAIKGYEIPKNPAEIDSEKNKASMFEQKIYSYENLNDDTLTDKISTLELTYTVEGTNVEKTHIVEFKTPVTKDQPDQLQLALKRNHLYRIVLTEKHADLKIVAKVIVDDWNKAEEFQIDDIPYTNAATADLLVNMFSPYNVKSFEINGLGGKTANKVLEFEKSLTCRMPQVVSSKEFETATYANISAPFSAPDQKSYRIPTKGELQLLIPDFQDGKGFVFTDAAVPASGPEVLYFENAANGSVNQQGLMLSGTSDFKKSSTTKVVNGQTVYTVYGLRFKGTPQCAAYRWEVCDLPANALDYQTGDNYISVKIKAVEDPAKTTIATVAKEDFWTEGFVEFKFPASGFSLLASQQIYNRKDKSLIISCTKEVDTPKKYYYCLDLGIKAEVNRVRALDGEDSCLPLRLVDMAKAEKLYAEHNKQYFDNLYKDVAVGDFLMKDGTIVKAAAMASQSEAIKQNAVAVVFSTNVERISAGARAAVQGTTAHGLAMALKDGTENGAVQWKFESTHTLPDEMFPYVNRPYKIYRALNGYEISKWMAANKLLDTHHVFKVVSEYQPAAPANTSGWYVPSTGEWIDIVQGLGGFVLDDSYKHNDKDKIDAWITSDGGTKHPCLDIAQKINTHLAKVGNKGTNYMEIDITTANETAVYWCANEYNLTGSCVMNFKKSSDLKFNSSGKINGKNNSNDHLYHVRSILAF